MELIKALLDFRRKEISLGFVSTNIQTYLPNVTLISIGHRNTLRELHDSVIDFGLMCKAHKVDLTENMEHLTKFADKSSTLSIH